LHNQNETKMKLLKHLTVLLICVVILKACRNDEPPERQVFVKESAVFKFYNNGDPDLERITLITVIHDPEDLPYTSLDALITAAKNSPVSCKVKTLNDSPFCSELHPYDSIVHRRPVAYIGCGRYAQFAVYYKDETSPDGYRLRGEYAVKDTIKQKYAINEYKYPDQTLIVNWPEDSLLFK
jgi:hypothetical protein